MKKSVTLQTNPSGLNHLLETRLFSNDVYGLYGSSSLGCCCAPQNGVEKPSQVESHKQRSDGKSVTVEGKFFWYFMINWKKWPKPRTHPPYTVSTKGKCSWKLPGCHDSSLLQPFPGVASWLTSLFTNWKSSFGELEWTFIPTCLDEPGPGPPNLRENICVKFWSEASLQQLVDN